MHHLAFNFTCKAACANCGCAQGLPRARLRTVALRPSCTLCSTLSPATPAWAPLGRGRVGQFAHTDPLMPTRPQSCPPSLLSLPAPPILGSLRTSLLTCPPHLVSLPHRTPSHQVTLPICGCEYVVLYSIFSGGCHCLEKKTYSHEAILDLAPAHPPGPLCCKEAEALLLPSKHRACSLTSPALSHGHPSLPTKPQLARSNSV